MKRNIIADILSGGSDGEKVTVCGWVRTKRTSKKFAFVVINDGSSQNNLQCIVDHGTPAFEQLDRVSTGASLSLTGVLRASPGKGQSWELGVEGMEVLGESGADYPLQKKGHSLEFLREISQYRSRTNTLGAVFRMRNQLSMAVHEFFQQKGFIWVHTPIITGNDCEGAGEMFQVTTMDLKNIPKDKDKVDFSKDFFSKPAHLTVSGQLQGEVFAMSHGQIYTFGPTFRAENSNTTRHLSEFWMIEPEIAFADLDDIVHLAQDFIQFLCKKTAETCLDEIAFLEKFYKVTKLEEIIKLSESKFERITYTNAIEILEKSSKKFDYPVKWGVDLQTEHERFLTDEHFKGPVVVTDYPKDIKAFYMRANDDGKTVAAMDVLAPRIGEIIGGSQREERLDLLQARMNQMDIDSTGIDWYLDLRRFGTTPHAGFGLGFERIVQYLSGMANIRDVIPFPRAPNSLRF